MFIVEGCLFVCCSCIGNGINTEGAPINIELKPKTEEEDVNIEFINTIIENCKSKNGKVQGIFMNGSYDQTFLFNSLSLIYTTNMNDNIIYLNLTGLTVTTIIQSSFKNKFINLCCIVNYKDNFVIGNYKLTDILDICDECESVSPSPSPSVSLLYDYFCPVCEDNLSCNMEESITCISPLSSCEEILLEGLCELSGMVVNNDNKEIMECVWIYDDNKIGEDKTGCYTIKESCSDFTSISNGEFLCSQTQLVKDNNECIWINDEDSDDDSGCYKVESSCSDIPTTLSSFLCEKEKIVKGEDENNIACILIEEEGGNQICEEKESCDNIETRSECIRTGAVFNEEWDEKCIWINSKSEDSDEGICIKKVRN
jgi:hypothetical protein